jgi:Fur family transcriptional regulator, peroxide stress response regulator
MGMESKLTPHRLAVLAIVKASKDHPTARDVFERSSRHSPKLSFATVYNALKFLTENGHVRQLRFGEDAVRYDPILDRHDHLVCRRCGKVDDAFASKPPITPDFKSLGGFQVEEITVQFLGICQACRKPGRPAPSPIDIATHQKPKRR